MNFTKPFRLGRKQKRAILDVSGLEVALFPVGHEAAAKIVCDLYNEDIGHYEHIVDMFDYGRTYTKYDIIQALKTIAK